jgi:hypothetical protein
MAANRVLSSSNGKGLNRLKRALLYLLSYELVQDRCFQIITGLASLSVAGAKGSRRNAWVRLELGRCGAFSLVPIVIR